MDEYAIFEVENDVVLFINNTEDLYYLQGMIYNNLSEKLGKSFNIIVDLFLRNGFSYNRFVSLSFEGEKKIKSYIINPRDLSEEVKYSIRSYLKNNPGILAESSLPTKVIEFVKTA